MRCPSCKFVSSDLRDICPRCLVDLRPYKKSYGLPVTKPDAPYKELLQKAAAKRFPTPAHPKKAPGGLGAFFRGVFGKKAVIPPPAPSAPVPAELEHPQPSAPVVVEPVPEEAAPLEPIISKIESTTTISVETPAAEPPQPAPVEFEASPPEEISLEFNLEEEPATTPPAPAAPVSEEYPDAFSEQLPAVDTPSPPPPAPGTVLRALFTERRSLPFDEVFDELSASEEPLEFSLNQLRNIERTEEIQLLFDLCHDFIESPQEEQRYISRITTSAERKIDARSLQLHLRAVEQQLSAPLLSLSAFRARRSEKEVPAKSTSSVLRGIALAPAPASRRMAALIADLSVLLSLSCLLGFAYGAREGFFHLHQIGGFEPLELTDLIPSISVAVCVALLGSIFYPLSAFLFFGRTIGMRLARIVLLRGNKKRLGLSNLLVRTLIHPLSVICLGYLPLLRNRRSLHDYFARTELFVPAGTA